MSPNTTGRSLLMAALAGLAPAVTPTPRAAAQAQMADELASGIAKQFPKKT